MEFYFIFFPFVIHSPDRVCWGFFVFVNQRRFSIWHRVVVSALPFTQPKTLCCQLFSSIFFLFCLSCVFHCFSVKLKNLFCWNSVGCCCYFIISVIVTIPCKDTCFEQFIKKRDEIRKFNKRLPFISRFNIQHITTYYMYKIALFCHVFISWDLRFLHFLYSVSFARSSEWWMFRMNLIAIDF